MAQLRRKPVSSSEKKIENPIAKAMSRARHSSFYHDFSLRGKNPLRLLGTPKDLWPGSITAGTQMVGGKIMAGGHVLENPNNEENLWPGGDIWLEADLNEHWQTYLHSFNWLRDLNQAVDRKRAQRRAEELVETWIDQNTQWGEISWRSDIVGERVTNWLIYVPLIMDTDDVLYRGRVLDILARSARHLMKISSDMPEGPAGLKAIIGLAFSGLFIPFGDAWLKQSVGRLKFSLGKEILVDGGIRSRNPQELLHLFMNMVLLRDAFPGMGKTVPDELEKAVKRMASCLSSLSLGDGKLSLFNGAGLQRNEGVSAFIIKSKEDLVGGVDLEQCGYSRIEKGQTVIITDTGTPAELEMSREAHAGTLSFEMSHAKERIIVNLGHAAYNNQTDSQIEYFSRSTEAHSTLVMSKLNSSDIRDDGLIGSGITTTSSFHYEENDHILLDAKHDGYQNLGFEHRRLLYMDDKGEDVRGEDNINTVGAINEKSDHAFNIFFHLHPNISVVQGEEHILLVLESGKKWIFHSSDAKRTISESVYFGDAGKILPNQSIKLSGKVTGDNTKVRWALKLMS